MQLDARLRAFAGFVRRGSFSGAAEELLISQPAISKHIADLERACGLRLIERRPRGGALTPAGEFLARHVLRAEAILAQAVRGLADLREPGSASLPIAASGVPGTYILPSAIAAFHQAYGAVRISLELGTSAQAIDAVRAHRAEIAFVGGFAAAPEIEAEALLEDEIVVVGAPVFATQSLSRDELESRVWIFRERGSATRATVEAALGDLGIVPRRRLELPSWEAIKLAVRRGDGVTACSRFAVAEELRAGALASIVVPLWNVRRRFSAVYLRDAPLTPAAHLFLAFARRQFGEQQV